MVYTMPTINKQCCNLFITEGGMRKKIQHQIFSTKFSKKRSTSTQNTELLLLDLEEFSYHVIKMKK